MTLKRHPAFDWAVIIAALCSLGGSIYIQATHHDQDNEHRISVLESHRQDDNDRLDRIEHKLDQLVEHLIK